MYLERGAGAELVTCSAAKPNQVRSSFATVKTARLYEQTRSGLPLLPPASTPRKVKSPLLPSEPSEQLQIPSLSPVPLSPCHLSAPRLAVRESGNAGTGNVAKLQQALGAQELSVLCPHKSFAIPPEQFSKQQRGCIPFPIS